MVKQANVSRSLLVVRIVIYGSLPLFLISALLYDLNLSGARQYRYRLGYPSSAVSQLFPAQRLEGIVSNSQRVLQQPVYFTVRYPHRYDLAVVRMHVDNPNQLRWRIGLEVPTDGAWGYYLLDPDIDGIVTLDLSNARVRQRTIRLLMSIPELKNEDRFAIKDIYIKLFRTTN